MVKLLSLLLILLTTTAYAGSYKGYKLNIFREVQIKELYTAAAQEVINQIKQKPNSVIIIPTDYESRKLFERLSNEFKMDKTIDLSKATFFVDHEYFPIDKANPYSKEYYIKLYFLDPLVAIDKQRSPRRENILIFGEQEPVSPKIEQFTKSVSDKCQSGIDLAILPIASSTCIKHKKGPQAIGGQIGLDDPQVTNSRDTVLLKLNAEQTKEWDSKFELLDHTQRYSKRFFQKPEYVEALSIDQIKQAKKIVILALNEDKAMVLNDFFEQKHPARVALNQLKGHKDILFLADNDAVSAISYRPWNDKSIKLTPNKYHLWRAFGDYLNNNPNKTLSECHMESFEFLPMELVDFIKKKRELLSRLQHGVEESQIPSHKKVLIISPHPEDDVVNTGALILRLKQNANDIHILYVVTGTNSVADNYPGLKPFIKKYKSEPNALIKAKFELRKSEAFAATAILGIPQSNLHFFNADLYHRRNIPSVDPITENDMTRIKTLLKEIDPSLILLASENDPFDAHGLSTEMVARALGELPQIADKVTILGYRGGYNEWPLYEAKDLMILPYNENDHVLKIKAIKELKSQLKIGFPTFDDKPLHICTSQRNKRTGKMLNQMLDGAFKDKPYAEVFKIFNVPKFIKLKEKV